MQLSSWEARYTQLVLGRSKGVLPALARLALTPLSLPYAAVAAVRNAAYDHGWKSIHRAGVPVLCVGNLTVGGTGKTPMVEHFAQRFRERQVRVAILSRGYGAADGPNDEALVLEENLPDVPHLQGRDRVQLARLAVEELESQLLILDDGFQHRRLGRDADVVLLDATAPFGGGRLLPAGLLRESKRGLKRARLVVLTRADAVSEEQRRRIRQQVRDVAGDRPWAEASFQPRCLQRRGRPDQPIAELAGRRVLAFCGIGNPSAFFEGLRAFGAEVVDVKAFADHHRYSRDDVTTLARWAREQPADLFVTTQKDLVKLRVDAIGSTPLAAVRIAAVIENGEREVDRLIEELSGSIPRVEFE